MGLFFSRCISFFSIALFPFLAKKRPERLAASPPPLTHLKLSHNRMVVSPLSGRYQRHSLFHLLFVVKCHGPPRPHARSSSVFPSFHSPSGLFCSSIFLMTHPLYLGLFQKSCGSCLYSPFAGWTSEAVCALPSEVFPPPPFSFPSLGLDFLNLLCC